MNPKYSPIRRTMRLALQLLLLVGFVLLSVWAMAQSTPTLITDQPDYAPGTTATLTGSGFRPGESVTLQVLHYDGTSDGGADHQPWTVTADSSGNFVTAWHVCEDDCVGSTLRATADGQTSSLHAQVVFTDAQPCWSGGVNISGPTAVCQGSSSSSYSLPTSGITAISWSLTSSGSGTSPTITAGTLGNATVTWPSNFSGSVTISAVGNCAPGGPTTKNLSVTVNPLPSASISYSGSPYCSTSPNVSVTQTGTTGGTYSASPAGLSINSGSGAVNIGTSTPGTYTVSYTVAASGGCATFTTSTLITINTPPSATISYSGSPYCSNGDIATVTQTGVSGGTYSSTSGLAINFVTGAVNLSASTSGMYTVTYTIPPTGGCSPVAATTSLSINNLPVSTIGANTTTICSGSSANIQFNGTPNATVVYTVNGSSPQAVTLNNGGNGTVSSGVLTSATTYSLVSVAVGDCAQLISGSVTITINLLPAITSQPENVMTTYGDGDVSFSVVATGAGLSYQWQVNTGSGFINTGSNSPTLTVANPTLAMNGYTYQVIVSGTCTPAVTSNVVSLTVKNPCTAPTLSVVASDVTCTGENNGSVDLITSGGSPAPFTYLWSNGATTEDVSGLAPGNYSVTVTTASGGCSSSINQTIGTVVDVTKPVISGVPADITITSNDANTTTCTQIATWVAPTATDNCSLASFTSDYVSGDAFAIGTTTVTYIATDASGNVQTASFTVTVNDNTKPVISIAPITVNTNSGCSATGVLLGTPITSDNCAVTAVTNDAPAVFPLGSTIVTWTVTDSNGNSASATQLVTVTDVEPPVFTNVSENIVLSACTSTASWPTPIVTDNCSVSVAQTAGPLSGSIFENGSITTISYTATDGSGNSFSASFTVARLTALAATASGVNVSCYGGNNGSASVSVSGGRSPYSYSWSNGGNTAIINGLVAGVYSVTVTDADGCTVSSSYSVTQPTALTASAAATAILCNGGSATVTISANGGTAPYSGIGTFSRSAGTWTFTVTDANGCTSTSTVTITEPSPLTAIIATNNSYLYFGYPGDQSATITAKPSGGTAPYTVAITMVNGDGSRIRTAGKLICDYINNAGDEIWTAGANTQSTVSGCGIEPTSTSKNNITAGGSYSINVTLLDDARFIATITDANGCSYTTPYASAARVDAEDVRCFGGNSNVQKVTLCHRTGSIKNPCITICVDESAVNDHLAHGDFFGPCNNTCTAPVANARVSNDDGGTNAQPLEVDTYPNPFRASLSVKVVNPENAEVTMNLIDVTGRFVDIKIQSKSDENVYTLETDKIGGGFYILRVNIGNVSKVIKVMKE